MSDYLCVICRQPANGGVRYAGRRYLRICEDHAAMTADQVLEKARPASKGSRDMFHARAALAARTRHDPNGDHSDLRRELIFLSLTSKIEQAMAQAEAAGLELDPQQRREILAMFK